tara:strand:+ start:376 stop:807 length:432 start_codon:yes stop_codon:yes gene_type:complete
LIDQVLKKYPDNVRVVIKNCPLKSHKDAMKLAQYSLAAREQEKYKEMYHYLMENQSTIYSNIDLPLEYAEEIGLDIKKFKEDADSPKIYNQIISETKQLIESTIERKGVPRFLIQGKELWVFNAKPNIEDFSRIIDNEIKKLK